MPIARGLLRTARIRPANLALADAERQLDAAGLVEYCGRLSAWLETELAEQRDKAMDVASPPEADGLPVVALVIENAFDLGRALAAVMCARAVVTVVDTAWPFAHRLDTIRRAQATLVVSDQVELLEALAAAPGAPAGASTEEGDDTDHASATVAAPSPRAISITDLDAQLAQTPPAAIEPRPDDEPFLLLFTSGTTNLPKGFIKTRANWRVILPISRNHYGAAEGLTTLAPGSLAYSLTMYGFVEALGTGGACLVAPDSEPFATAALIEARAAERFVGVPAAVHALAVLARRRPESLSSLRWAITGGANLSARMRDDFEAALPAANLVSYYGAAEIGFIGWSTQGDGTRLRLFDGVTAQVRSPEGEDLPDGELGTLHLRADATCVPAYLASTTDVVLKGPDGWATVGDQARRLSDREIVLLGRAGDVVVTGGHKVALPEVERALAGVPGCERSCVIAVPHDVLGVELIALIEPGPNADETCAPTKARILEHLRVALAPQFVPKRFYTVAALPRTASGKVRRTETTTRVADGFEGFEGVERL